MATKKVKGSYLTPFERIGGGIFFFLYLLVMPLIMDYIFLGIERLLGTAISEASEQRIYYYVMFAVTLIIFYNFISKNTQRFFGNLNQTLSTWGMALVAFYGLNELLFRALVRAILAAVKERGIRKLSFLLPFVSECREVSYLKGIITGYASADGIETTIGIEIATPRAACIAGELAAQADAMVFNVEELVQLLYGMSRFDTRKVISCYLHENVFRHNPFVEFDEIGIGTLLMIALKQIRRVRPQMRLSAIGHCVLSEKGRKFCQDAGIDILIAQQHQFRAEHIPSSHNR